MKRYLKNFFIALFCMGHKAWSKPRRNQLFIEALGRRRAAIYRFFGYDVRMKRTGEYWFQLRDRKEQRKIQKRIIHALTKP